MILRRYAKSTKGESMGKGLPKPENLVYLPEIEVQEQKFEVGESVWIEGRRKSPSSNNLLAQIVRNTRSNEVYVNVFCEYRGKAQWHSFAPSALKKRQKKRKN